MPGLCKVATIAEIEAQGWSLNPGRYVGVAAVEEDDDDFAMRLAELHEEFTTLSATRRRCCGGRSTPPCRGFSRHESSGATVCSAIVTASIKTAAIRPTARHVVATGP